MRQVDRVRKTRSYVGSRGFPRSKLFLPQNRAPRLTTYLPYEYVGLGGRALSDCRKNCFRENNKCPILSDPVGRALSDCRKNCFRENNKCPILSDPVGRALSDCRKNCFRENNKCPILSDPVGRALSDCRKNCFRENNKCPILGSAAGRMCPRWRRNCFRENNKCMYISSMWNRIIKTTKILHIHFAIYLPAARKRWRLPSLPCFA